ncbi:acetoin utilization protein AcuC [Oceanibaculum indicum]|uniref:Acetoin utilization protein AcuC n=1 Tax=Oceanibaculum indicum TaxID=526216 RepID=A0A420WQ44_9PROT|nr:acetoin utilization protein AcuC [Oceanibaculum indicum]RKQ73157.1 acetoin utilization protein AcuC [Oceanibaculum indicum]
MLEKPILLGSDIYRHSIYGRKHPLSIPRVSLVLDLIRALGWFDEARYRAVEPATREQLTRFHAPDYVEALMRAEETRHVPPEDQERYNIGRNGNPVFAEIFRRPATSCAASILAAGLLRKGGVVHNPAGGTHHGRPDRASGFCYFNDAVLAILAFLDQGLERVLYIDLDAHHGDGVQDAFHDEERVLTVSIHEQDRWPRTGALSDRAGGMARNIPVPAGFNDTELAFLVAEALLPLADRFQPQALVLQCGCDGLEDDPQSRLSLSNRAIWDAVATLHGQAPRTLVLGGGGYNPWAVARCWAGIWGVLNSQPLNGQPLDEPLPMPAQSLLREIVWNHSRGRTPPEHWFTTLADAARPGPVRPEIRAAARAILED